MTKQELGEMVQHLKMVFDEVRLVDVTEAQGYTVCCTGEIEPQDCACYAIWSKSKRCENCISAKAFAEKTRLTKFEFLDDRVFHVISMAVCESGCSLRIGCDKAAGAACG